MNGIEEVLRRELRDRAEAGDREVALLRGVERRIGRIRRRRALAASALAASACVAVALGATPLRQAIVRYDYRGPVAGGPVHGTMAGQASGFLTPPGWAPVSYGGAQISVPANWLLEGSGGSACGGAADGMVFLGQPPRRQVFAAMGCQLAANVVTLSNSAAGPRLAHYRHGPAHRLASGKIMVYARRDPDGALVYMAPAIGVNAAARGPLASRVLTTLTRSPRSVVLARGPLALVPAGWRWHEFGGIAFAAPATWTVERNSTWGGCPYGIAAATIRLSTATEFSAPGCPGPPPTAGFHAARPGVVVGAGRYAALAVASAATVQPCLRLHGMRACVLRPGFDDALLGVAVYLPGAARPTLVEIGLAGSGATARAIFDSIRPLP